MVVVVVDILLAGKDGGAGEEYADEALVAHQLLYPRKAGGAIIYGFDIFERLEARGYIRQADF